MSRSSICCGSARGEGDTFGNVLLESSVCPGVVSGLSVFRARPGGGGDAFDNGYMDFGEGLRVKGGSSEETEVGGRSSFSSVSTEDGGDALGNG